MFHRDQFRPRRWWRAVAMNPLTVNITNLARATRLFSLSTCSAMGNLASKYLITYIFLHEKRFCRKLWPICDGNQKKKYSQTLRVLTRQPTSRSRTGPMIQGWALEDCTLCLALQEIKLGPVIHPFVVFVVRFGLLRLNWPRTTRIRSLRSSPWNRLLPPSSPISRKKRSPLGVIWDNHIAKQPQSTWFYKKA